MRGPTPDSNWVIPGRLMAGAYPGNVQDEVHQTTIAALIDAGVTAFVSLITQDEMTKYHLRPYKDFASEYAAERNGKELEFLSFPTPDGFIRMDTEVVEFIQRLFGRLKLHPVSCLYLHCRHGRGRTGTIAALLLVQYYSMDPTRALSLTGLYHSQRVNSRGKSPQTRAQCSQVVRLAPVLTPPADKS